MWSKLTIMAGLGALALVGAGAAALKVGTYRADSNASRPEEQRGAGSPLPNALVPQARNSRPGVGQTTRVDQVAPAPVPEKSNNGKATAVGGGDWPQWRGPNRDGIVLGVKLPVQWPRELPEDWKAPVGEGYASPVVVGKNVYVFTRQKDDEIVLCFDIVNGKQLWRSEPCPAPFKAGPAAPGDIKPRATPAVAAGRVFTLGVSEILSCLDAETGKLLWRKPSKGYPIYGASASPLVVDGLCIAQVGKGGLTAFDVATGAVKWCYDDVIGGPGYGSPILVDMAGERHVVTVTQNCYLGVKVATGQLLWRLPVPRWDIQQCITPVQYKDLLVIADSGSALRAIRLEKTDQGIMAKEVWKAKAHTSDGYHMCSPVVAGDWLLGFSGQKTGHLFCLDAKTGETLWQSEGRLGGMACNNASIVNAGGVWLALSNRGHLTVMKATDTACEPIAEYRLAESGTDAYPVLVEDRLLIKDDTTLRCFRIAPDPKARTRPADGRKQTCLDLQPKANLKLRDDVGVPENNLAMLLTGEQTLAGVRWNIGQSLILLSGKATADRPDKAEGIKVGTACAKLHFLHGAHFQAPDDTVIGYYTINYEDKSLEKVPIVYGKDVSDWWYTEGTAVPSRAKVAWTGENDAARKTNGSKIRLYLMTWNNPHPSRKIVSIDLASTNSTNAAPFCVAMTIEE
jgi:outer membrane protein assembly factor BamB